MDNSNVLAPFFGKLHNMAQGLSGLSWGFFAPENRRGCRGVWGGGTGRGNHREAAPPASRGVASGKRGCALPDPAGAGPAGASEGAPSQVTPTRPRFCS